VKAGVAACTHLPYNSHTAPLGRTQSSSLGRDVAYVYIKSQIHGCSDKKHGCSDKNSKTKVTNQTRQTASTNTTTTAARFQAKHIQLVPTLKLVMRCGEHILRTTIRIRWNTPYIYILVLLKRRPYQTHGPITSPRPPTADNTLPLSLTAPVNLTPYTQSQMLLDGLCNALPTLKHTILTKFHKIKNKNI